MNAAILAGIAFSSALFGLGTGALLDHILSLLRSQIVSAKLKTALVALATILGWFLGTRSLTLGVFQKVDFSEIGVSQKLGYSTAAVAYVGGFGLAVGYLLFVRYFRTTEKDGLIIEFRKFLIGFEIEVALLVNRYELTTKQTASKLGISDTEVGNIYLDVMRKLKKRYKNDATVFDLLKNRPL